MKPGEDGGSEPFTCLLFLRRRQRKPHAKRRAASARIPKGIPTPRPIFCVFVRPFSSADGASGSLAIEVEEDVAEVDLVKDTIDDDNAVDVPLEDLLEDLVAVENVTTEDTIVVGVPVADDCVALLGVEEDPEMTVPVVVTWTAVVWRDAEGHAVSGPNLMAR